MRQLAFLILVAGLSAASHAEAQVQPLLAIYCTSAAQEYCMSFLSWDVQFTYWDEEFNETDPADAFVAYANWRSKIQVYGNAFPAETSDYLFSVIPDVSGTGDWEASLVSDAYGPGPGYYRMGDSGPARRFEEEDAPDVSTPADVELIRFVSDGVILDACQPGIDCVEVPEPMTGFLLLSGLSAIGLCWRTRNGAGGELQ